MSWDVEFAKEFRRRDNKLPLEPQIGEVISASPLRIAMMTNKVIVEQPQIYLCARLAEGQAVKCDAKLQTINETGEITFKQILKVGDRVACIPTSGGNKFIVIDRVV